MTYRFMIGFGRKPDAHTDENVTLCPGIAGTRSAGNIVPIHLDEIRSPSEQEHIIGYIKALPVGDHTTVFLLSSPQSLVRPSSMWLPLIHWLIDNGRLSMVPSVRDVMCTLG